MHCKLVQVQFYCFILLCLLTTQGKLSRYNLLRSFEIPLVCFFKTSTTGFPHLITSNDTSYILLVLPFLYNCCCKVWGSKVPAWGSDNLAALADETLPVRLWTLPPADSRTRGSSCGSEVTVRRYSRSGPTHISSQLCYLLNISLHAALQRSVLSVVCLYKRSEVKYELVTMWARLEFISMPRF